MRAVAQNPKDVDLTDSVGFSARLSFENASEAADFVARADDRAAGRSGRVESRRRALDEIIIVTTDSVPGSEIIAVHGDVFGVVVRARNIFSNMAAGLRTVAGGEVAGYTKLMSDTRNDARERLAVAAVDRGANAVVAMRYSTAEVAELMSEIVAYGTAVTIRCPR